MSDEFGEGVQSQSKFEWRPEDITILTDEEAAAAEVEYQDWLSKLEEDADSNSGGKSFGD